MNLPQKKARCTARRTLERKKARCWDLFVNPFTARLKKIHDLTAKKQLPILVKLRVGDVATEWQPVLCSLCHGPSESPYIVVVQRI